MGRGRKGKTYVEAKRIAAEVRREVDFMMMKEGVV